MEFRFTDEQIGLCHQLMCQGKQPPGVMAVRLRRTPRKGMRDVE